MPISQTMVDELTQLEAQQAAITNALSAMLEGTWTGAGSVQAYLLALDPNLRLAPRPPDYSVAPTPPSVTWDQNAAQSSQRADWTCSACALAWVLRATGVNPRATEDTEVGEIGEPSHINPTYGLMDAAGSALRSVYERYGVRTSQGWLTFDQVWTLAGETTGQMSGGAWYHWVALRGRIGSDIWIANSAPGYKGVSERLSSEDFNRLGPFSVVWINH